MIPGLDPTSGARTKHIDIRYHFVRQVQSPRPGRRKQHSDLQIGMRRPYYQCITFFFDQRELCGLRGYGNTTPSPNLKRRWGTDSERLYDRWIERLTHFYLFFLLSFQSCRDRGVPMVPGTESHLQPRYSTVLPQRRGVWSMNCGASDGFRFQDLI